MSFALRNLAINEEFDYLLLKEGLKSYRFPRAKITALLKNHTLIRVKKGLYLFGKTLARKPVVKEVLANLIYGPSCLSLEYALSFHGFIPERVETFTSITSQRNKTFLTPVGRFTYRYLHPSKYSIGITQLCLDPTHFILIATPEKALADMLLLNRPHLSFQNASALENFLLKNLRIDPQKLLTLDSLLLATIALAYGDATVSLLADYIKTRTEIPSYE